MEDKSLQAQCPLTRGMSGNPCLSLECCTPSVVWGWPCGCWAGCWDWQLWLPDRGPAPGDGGSGWAGDMLLHCAPLPAPTLTLLISAIYSEVYFLYQMPSPAQQELMGAHWEKRPCSWALNACSMDTNHSAWWDGTLQPPALSQGQLWCYQQCSVGREQGHASYPGVGWGCGDWGGGWCCFVLFFRNVPHVCPTVAGAGWGDYFLFGQREACQMRIRLITLFF